MWCEFLSIIFHFYETLRKKCIKSPSNSIQKSLINPRFISSSPELLKLSYSQTTCFTSSREKGLIKSHQFIQLNILKFKLPWMLDITWPEVGFKVIEHCCSNIINTLHHRTIHINNSIWPTLGRHFPMKKFRIRIFLYQLIQPWILPVHSEIWMGQRKQISWKRMNLGT